MFVCAKSTLYHYEQKQIARFKLKYNFTVLSYFTHLRAVRVVIMRNFDFKETSLVRINLMRFLALFMSFPVMRNLSETPGKRGMGFAHYFMSISKYRVREMLNLRYSSYQTITTVTVLLRA